jgi:hypothetical protein
MEKRLCWGSMGVACFVLLLFLLDLLTSFPFGRLAWYIDVISILGSVLVLLLAWDALRDLR